MTARQDADELFGPTAAIVRALRTNRPTVTVSAEDDPIGHAIVTAHRSGWVAAEQMAATVAFVQADGIARARDSVRSLPLEIEVTRNI